MKKKEQEEKKRKETMHPERCFDGAVFGPTSKNKYKQITNKNAITKELHCLYGS
jgi:hypothetical protein